MKNIVVVIMLQLRLEENEFSLNLDFKWKIVGEMGAMWQ